MAKLNVKVINETVEYNGFVYESVTDGAKTNDLIQCFEDDSVDLTYEAFYLVIGTDDSNDMQFLDDDNDERDRSVTDEDFKVFRKSHAITIDKLTDAEGVVKIELPDGTKLEGTPSDLEKITRSMQALQAEQVATVEVSEETVEVEYEGEMVSERLQVGDYVKVITNDDNGQSKFGDIVKVTEDDESNIPFDTKHLDGSYAGWHYEKDLVRATEAEVKAATTPKDEPLKVGDFAKVVGNESDVYEKGSIVKITDVPYRKWDYQAIGIKKDDEIEEAYEQFFKRELVKATNAEALEAKQALLKEGDFARVISNDATTKKAGAHKFEIGTVVKLKMGSWDKDVFKSHYLNESDWWNVHRKDLEPLTKEEAEHIAREAEEEKKAKAERAKWAAIGREVGEIKKGDIVRTTTYSGSVNPIGTIGIAEFDGTVESTATLAEGRKGGNYSSVELIVPVEQRFDTLG
ncbi:Uncharacterized protein B5E38_2656 [Bacillus cereus]|nr:Uncharacterized protein B5E38_2656 [Bacillus cereus]ARO65514.1 Uncharacterized protein B5E39_3179 [Bacillus cereus]